MATAFGLLGQGQTEGVNGAGFFVGSEFSVADSKGRFTLPPDMRKLLRATSSDHNKFCLNMHEKQSCAVGFGTARLDDISREIEEDARLHRERGAPFDAEAAYERKLSALEIVSFDDGGRFFLPAYVRKTIGAEKYLVYSGVGTHLQFWSPDYLLASEGRPEPLRAKVEAFLAQMEAAGK